MKTLSSRLMVMAGYLFVQCPQVIEPAQQKETAGKQPEDAGYPFAEIETVDAEHAKEGEQYPRNGEVSAASGVAPVGIPVHRRNQEQVDNPAYK